ncbi:hypothetical protein [Streptomyces sp. NBC_00376]
MNGEEARQVTEVELAAAEAERREIERWLDSQEAGVKAHRDAA